MAVFHFHHRPQQPESYGENIKYSNYWFDNPKLIEYPQVQWTKQNEFFDFKFQKKLRKWRGFVNI